MGKKKKRRRKRKLNVVGNNLDLNCSQAFKAANPRFNSNQIASLAGREWKGLHADDKDYFEDRIRKMKAAYNEKVGKNKKAAPNKKWTHRVRPSYSNLVQLCNTMAGVFREQLARENAMRKPHAFLWTPAVLALSNLSEEVKFDAIDRLKSDTDASIIFMALDGAMRERYFLRKFAPLK